MAVVLICLGLMSLTLLALAILTALGASRRGVHPIWAPLAGLAFPITWAVWYVRDRRGNVRAA